MATDPTVSDPDHYRVVFENDAVRVLEYTDSPGDVTKDHDHPDSVMITLSSFRRRISSGTQTRDVHLDAGEARWVPAQRHKGENIGSTPSHSIFVELKIGSVNGRAPDARLGPAD
jgi:hypothetical protein